MNSINLTGNMTADASIRTAGERKVATFTVAVRGYKDHTDFIRVSAFGNTAEYLEKYGKKGCRVAVSGSLHTDSYEKDGNKVNTVQVNATNVEVTPKASADAPVETTPATEDFTEVPDDEELPFGI